jgi:hypothetical protein
MATGDPGTKVGGQYADWTRFTGRIQSNAAEASTPDTPQDYRDVVNGYFRALSQRGAQVDSTKE